MTAGDSATCEQTVSAGFVSALLRHAVSRAATRDALLASACIDAAALDDSDARLPPMRVTWR